MIGVTGDLGTDSAFTTSLTTCVGSGFGGVAGTGDGLTGSFLAGVEIGAGVETLSGVGAGFTGVATDLAGVDYFSVGGLAGV